MELQELKESVLTQDRIMNRFVFIIPFYNCKDYIKDCVDSILAQKYRNWIAIFADDASTDNSLKVVPEDSRFIKFKSSKRRWALENIHRALELIQLDDEDVICLLDGDDYLCRDTALNIINSLYQDNTLITYGNYLFSDKLKGGHCREYTEKEFNNMRKNHILLFSHLRTFKYKVYKELLRQDPDVECFKDEDGNFYEMSYDVALMVPLMEIAGLNRIKFNKKIVYMYRIHSNNDHNVNYKLQCRTTSDILKKKRFLWKNLKK